jgi:hypothetical protein
METAAQDQAVLGELPGNFVGRAIQQKYLQSGAPRPMSSVSASA